MMNDFLVLFVLFGMFVGLLGVVGCIVQIIRIDMKEKRDRATKETNAKIELLEFMASQTDENEYFKMCDELGLCSKSSVTEVILGIEK